MLHIKVVGSGCMNCDKLAAMCQTIVIEKKLKDTLKRLQTRIK